MSILHIHEPWDDGVTYDAHSPDKCGRHPSCTGQTSVIVPDSVAEMVKALLDAYDHVQKLLADLYHANTTPPGARRDT